MVLLAMNWKRGRPPADFVGFAIEYREPKGDVFRALQNRITFPAKRGAQTIADQYSTLRSPIQKFRWIHFPVNADMSGKFAYRVTPVFMDGSDALRYGEAVSAQVELARETYPGKLNIAFTRGFVSSQAFVDRYESKGPISSLLPARANRGLNFVPTHPEAQEAFEWMGFEARSAILELLDRAIADKKADVRAIAYDLNEPEVITRLERLGSRLRVIIDNSGAHGKPGSAENEAEKRLKQSAGEAQVKRQRMGGLQHNKIIVVDGQKLKVAVCGSTNFSWRGFFVQANNAVIVTGKAAIEPFAAAFEDYWENQRPPDFGETNAAKWNDLRLKGIRAQVAFSPHSENNALLGKIAADIGTKTRSSLFYSLAFLYQTPGALQDAIKKISKSSNVFVYGISDRKVGGLDLEKPSGNVSPVYPSALTEKNTPEPFKSEPAGGSGTRMHHKFVVIDFDRPTARVYLGSYNFSSGADTRNGENLMLIQDERVATSYMVEAVRLFDHYHFRLNQSIAKKAKKRLELAKPPRKSGEEPWWLEDYTDQTKIRDRKLFA